MTIEYYQFEFARFKPKKLERLARFVSLDTFNIAPDSYKLDRLKDKLRSEGEELRSSEIKFLCFFANSLKQEGLFSKFGHVCHKCFTKGLLSSYYDNFTDPELYKLLQLAIVQNSVWKEPLTHVKDIVLGCQDTTSFIQALYRPFKGCLSFAEIQNVKHQYYMNDNHVIFQSILLRILDAKVVALKCDEDFDFVREITDSYKEINVIKPSFEKFLLTQSATQYFDDQPAQLEEMFKLIGNKLGDAYGVLSRNKWQGISEEAKRVFTLWKTQKNIKYLFGDIAGDQIRLNFWKKYSHYVYRIEYNEKYDGAILMETKEHLFIEFAKMGAMHMYYLKNLSIDQVNRDSKVYGKTAMIARLKNKAIAEIHLKHQGYYWPELFETEFRYYHYEMRK